MDQRIAPDGQAYFSETIDQAWIEVARKDLKELCEKHEAEGVTRVMLLAFLANAIGRLMPTVPEDMLGQASVDLTVRMNLITGYTETMETIAPLVNPQGSA